MLIIHPGNVPTLHSETNSPNSQSMFLSIAYRHTDNADKNASNIIKQRAIKLILNFMYGVIKKEVSYLFVIVDVEPK